MRPLPWTPAHNVWTVGKIVFDLSCHADHDDLDDLMKTECPYTFEGEKIFNRRRGHFMVKNWDPLFAKIQGPNNVQSWHYSSKLKDIIRDCLFPEAARRPGTQALLDQAKAGRDTYLNSLHIKHDSKTPAAIRKRKRMPLRFLSPAAENRLYFRHDEINTMGRGPMRLEAEARREVYKSLRRGHDPDYPMLRPPQDGPYLGLVPRKRDENKNSVPQMVLKNRTTGEILRMNEFQVYLDDHDEGEAELNARIDHGDDSGDDEDGDGDDSEEHDLDEDSHIAAYNLVIRMLERKIARVRRRRRNAKIRMQQAEDDEGDDTNYRKKIKDYNLYVRALRKRLAAIKDMKQAAHEEYETAEQSPQHESGEDNGMRSFSGEMDSEGAISDPALRDSRSQ